MSYDDPLGTARGSGCVHDHCDVLRRWRLRLERVLATDLQRLGDAHHPHVLALRKNGRSYGAFHQESVVDHRAHAGHLVQALDHLRQRLVVAHDGAHLSFVDGGDEAVHAQRRVGREDHHGLRERSLGRHHPLWTRVLEDDHLERAALVFQPISACRHGLHAKRPEAAAKRQRLLAQLGVGGVPGLAIHSRWEPVRLADFLEAKEAARRLGGLVRELCGALLQDVVRREAIFPRSSAKTVLGHDYTVHWRGRHIRAIHVHFSDLRGWQKFVTQVPEEDRNAQNPA
eukprot:scaffold310_cov307-Pinguiococcus_pyrenoidosus.AAC.11